MTDEWRESAADGGVILEFDGLDLDAQDELDMENFARGLKEPAKEDPGGKAFATTARMQARAISPRDAVKLFLALAFSGVAFVIAGELDLKEGPGYAIVGAAFFLGYATPAIVTAVLKKKAAPIARSTAEHFRITVGPAELVVEGERASRLVCGLKTKFHPPLAARLNDLVAKARG
jgi:hypothetical protein